MALSTPACAVCLAASEALVQGPAAGLRALQLAWPWGAGVALAGLAVGYWSGLFHQRWIADHGVGETSEVLPVEGREGPLRLGVIRFWVHLPFFTGPTLFWVLWTTLSRGDLVQRGSNIVPLWFQLGPLMRSWQTDGDFPGTPPTLPRLAHGFPRWAFWLPVMVMVAAQGGEIYGEPVVLLTLGTYWVGDYLALWWVLRAVVLVPSRAV